MANTALTVTFVTDVITDDSGIPIDASVQVRLDSDRNEDRTRFLYGSKAYFQVFTAPSELTLELSSSDGNITEEGTGEETITTYVNFPDTNQGDVSFPVAEILYDLDDDGLPGTRWLGEGLGAIHAEGDKIVASQSGIGVLKITYKANFRRYAISINDQGVSEYYVLVYILGVI